MAEFFDDSLVDHVTLYVTDLADSTRRFVEGYGLAVYAAGERPGPARSAAVGRNRIRLLLTEPLSDQHPGAAYLRKHGDGVADIALRVPDAATAFAEAVRRGARPVADPGVRDGIGMASIAGFGDVTHTFIQRPTDQDDRALPGLGLRPEGSPDPEPALFTMDHFAVCVEAGQLDPTVKFYERVLGFKTTFAERIVVGAQAMDSKVVQNRSGSVTLTIIEPDLTHNPGQIDDFLKGHNGPGVQHIAFATDDIVRTVGAMATRGIAFLTTPAAYYPRLAQRLTPARHAIDDLQRLHILADEDQDGQLFQIFTRSVHPRKTFFLEIIERAGARTFGSRNIKALYEAVELDSNAE
jgi:4-hydroxymandelate synthase